MITIKKTLLLLFLLSVSLTTIAQTNVSGGIFTNTTWTKANSPYIATDTVVIFPGVTLTIEPGVIIRFNQNVRLEVLQQASLIAKGTTFDSITFTSNQPTPSFSSWAGIYFGINSNYSQFDFCNILYANKGMYAHNMYDTITVKHSVFAYNDIGLGWIYQSQVFVDSCLFINNINGVKYAQGVVTMSNSVITQNQNGILSPEGSSYINCKIEHNSSIGIQLQQRCKVVNCDIKNNGIGLETVNNNHLPALVTRNVIEDNNVGVRLLIFGDSIFCNKICGNHTYDLQNSIPNHYTASVANNYWCTNDSAVISSKIYDGYDDVSFSLIDFMPIDVSQCYLTGCNLSTSATINNATCNTCNDGEATVAVFNGDLPYTYTWYTSPLQTTQTAINLTPGNHIVCVADANGCTACDTIFVDSTNCNGLSVSAQSVNATCALCSDGSIQTSVTGGTAPYSYTWYTSPMQSTSVATGLPQGLYTFCVSDGHGCVVCDSAAVSIGNCSAHFDLFADTIPHNYYAINMASGVPPLTYSWNWGDGTTSPGPFPSHAYSTAGLYTICLTITDSVGCTNTYCNGFFLHRTENTMINLNVVSPLSTGVLPIADNKSFHVFPNPASGILNVLLPVEMIEPTIRIFNVLGELELQPSLQQKTSIDISALKSGIHIIEVATKEVAFRQNFIKR